MSHHRAMARITERIDRITLLEGACRSPTPPVPRSVKIELTARCDFRCFFCASAMRLRDKGEIDRRLFRRVLLEMRALGVEEIGLFYLGESLLCRWLPEAVTFAKRNCGYPYVFLTTNGRMASGERVRECIEAGLDSLKFSFNFSGPEQFHEVTGVRAAEYWKIEENLKAARHARDEIEARSGHRCGIYASSIRYDDAQLGRMEAAVARILPFVDEHYWLPLYGQAGLTAGARGTVATAGNQGRIGALRPPLPCWSLFTEGHVTWDGRLSACCFDHDGRFDMGDLTCETFLEAWHSERFQRLRRASLARDVRGTECEKCIAYDEPLSPPAAGARAASACSPA
jgi:hypothetical protein